MGLFDGYFDPEQFGEGGGLLGRLLALQQRQGTYNPTDGFDHGASTLHARSSQPNSGYDQPSLGSSMASSNLVAQFQALRPLLGDHYAMIATINPDIGKLLIAHATANQQRQDEPRKGSSEHGRGCSCSKDESGDNGCGCP
jgi:hypothetical protein